MYYLLVGFITPAVVFAILGFIACWRRNTSVDFKEYETIASTDTERELHKLTCYHMQRTPPPSFSMTFQNKYFLPFELPPSYSEISDLEAWWALLLLKQKRPFSTSSSRHLPRENERRHSSSKLRPANPVIVC